MSYPYQPGGPPPGYPQPGYRTPPHYPARPGYPVAPSAPSDVPLFQIGLYRHTGVLIAFFTRGYAFTGTLAQCEKAYRDAQLYNLLAGWWSLASIVALNWIALGRNLHNVNKLRRIAREPPAPAPPTPYQQHGFHGQQHWGPPGRR
jgi:hypothetical protein